MPNTPVVRTLRIVLAGLLLFNGLGALFGGYSLMKDPSGSQIQLPANLLEHSPFSSYFIPGLILFCFNGVFSIVALFAVLLKLQKYTFLVILQGLILLTWILVQITMIRTLSYLHFVLGGTAILLIVTGVRLRSLKTV